jgi:flavodoxin
MNVVILCDSKFGNTRRLAEAMRTALADGHAVELRATDEGLGPVAGVDLLLVGGPTHAHGASAPLRKVLGTIAPGSLRGTRTATFDTRYHGSRLLTGSAAATAGKALKRAGGTPAVDPESFFVSHASPPALEPGELERAAAWARRIVD